MVAECGPMQRSAAPSPTLPEWSRKLAALYESEAASQFILHGNVQDLFLVPGGQPRLGSLGEFLAAVLLAPFDVVLSFDPGNGLRVERGGEIFQEWPSAKDKAWPRGAREAIHFLTHYFRFCANLRSARGRSVAVACIIRDANWVAPAGPAGGGEAGAAALQIRDWAADPLLAGHSLATILVAENLSDLHPVLVQNPRAERIEIPLPDEAALGAALHLLAASAPAACAELAADPSAAAALLSGATLAALRRMVRLAEHAREAVTPRDLGRLKKEMVERDAQGLVEFIPPARSLADVQGMEAVKEWIRQDLALWRKGALAAMPMGYLLCGPVGTGKTYLAECLAGEADVPVVKLANFRDRWVGSTEANLERIFRLLHGLGRCFVFVDEADQALGRRDSGSGDSGLSGRVYAMIAKEMSDSRNRGRIVWLLASSRPDLIEVDLKRPGRVDVKIPLLPAATPGEAFALLAALCKRRGVMLEPGLESSHGARLPEFLTPGAAEALAVKIARQVLATDTDPVAALESCLADYQAPVAAETMRFQIGLAVREATELRFVPEVFRDMA
jgi:hypothetical protein